MALPLAKGGHCFFMEDEHNSYLDNMLEHQYTVTIMQYAMFDKRLTTADRMIYVYISGYPGLFFEKKGKTAEKLGLQPETVKKAKAKLEKLGYIKCVKDDGFGKTYETIQQIALREANDKLVGKKRTRKSTKMTKDERTQWIKDKQDALAYWEKKKMPKIVANTTRNNYALARLLKNKNVGLEGIKKMLDYVAYKRGDICNVNPIKVSDWCDLEYKANGIMDKAIKFSQR